MVKLQTVSSLNSAYREVSPLWSHHLNTRIVDVHAKDRVVSRLHRHLTLFLHLLQLVDHYQTWCRSRSAKTCKYVFKSLKSTDLKKKSQCCSEMYDWYCFKAVPWGCTWNRFETYRNPRRSSQNTIEFLLNPPEPLWIPLKARCNAVNPFEPPEIPWNCANFQSHQSHWIPLNLS